MAHTNGIESVGVLASGFYGTFHHFTRNTRNVMSMNLPTGSTKVMRVHTMDRIDALITKTLGVRLTYANLTGEFA